MLRDAMDVGCAASRWLVKLAAFDWLGIAGLVILIAAAAVGGLDAGVLGEDFESEICTVL